MNCWVGCLKIFCRYRRMCVCFSSLMLFVGLRHFLTLNSTITIPRFLCIDYTLMGNTNILIKLILRKTPQPHGSGHAVQYGDFYT